MSIICAARKDGTVAISADTQTNFGSLKVSSHHIANSSKLYTVNGSTIGIVGWTAISDIVEHAIATEPAMFRLGSRTDIYSTLLWLHKKMKEEYHIETREEDDQPTESNQLTALIVNRHGMFQISSYRSVMEYETYCAIGSGGRLALGAMHALYGTRASAKQLVEAGVKAAAEFDDGCGLPCTTKTRKLERVGA